MIRHDPVGAVCSSHPRSEMFGNQLAVIAAMRSTTSAARPVTVRATPNIRLVLIRYIYNAAARDDFQRRGRETIVLARNLSALARVSSETMLTSHAPRRTHKEHCNPNLGTGRSMACRPVGLCPPERLDRGWSANGGPRCTRVSAMRVVGFGGASHVRALQTPRPARRVSARREIG